MSWRDNIYYRYYVQQPLITRTYLTGIILVSTPPLLYLCSPVWFLNFWDYTLRGELWRPLTAFLFGGGGLNLLFGIFFAYQYSTQLETGKFGDSTADYAYYMVFSMLNLMFLNYFLSSPWYFNALTLSLCTTAVLENPTLPTNLFGLISLESQYLPYALLALTFVQVGPHESLCQATGLVNAHIWRHLRETMPAQGGLNYLATPGFMTRIFGTGGFLTPTAQTAAQGGTSRSFGQVFRPNATIPINNSSTSTTTMNGPRSAASGRAPEGGRTVFRGSGHVLGGE